MEMVSPNFTWNFLFFLCHSVKTFCLDNFFFVSNATTCPCGLRGPPSWAWQQCWHAHEAQLRCPDDVSGDTGGCSARKALKPNSTNLRRPWSPRESSPFRENSHGRAGNRTRDLMISSQRLWPLDHEAGLHHTCNIVETEISSLPVRGTVQIGTSPS